MALVNGKQSSSLVAVLLVDGYNLLASKVSSLGWKKGIPVESTTGLGDSWQENAPTGVQSLTITQGQSFFDTATNSIHDAFKAMALTVRLIAFAPNGNEFGALCYAAQGVYSQNYDAAPTVGALTKANAGYAVSGSLDEGVIVQTWTTKTIDWNTKTDGNQIDFATDASQTVVPITSATKANPCVVTTTQPHNLATGNKVLISANTLSGPSINADSTVTVLSATTFSVAINTTASTGAGTGGTLVLTNTLNGAVGHQQVSALTGLTGFIGKIRHSADDSTYADLITFTNVTAAPAAERKTVTGTIHRYLCFDGDVTGTGSLKPFAGLSRNAA